MTCINTSRLIQTLLSLELEELQDLKKWLRSPWCNSNKRLIKLFDVLFPYLIKNELPPIEKQKIMRKVYGKQADEKQFRNLMTALNKSIHDFLACRKVLHEQELKERLLIEEYTNRNRPKAFLQLSKQLIGKQAEVLVPSWKDYLQLTVLHNNIYYSPDQSFNQVEAAQYLDQANEYLDLFYISLKARFVCEYIERAEVLSDSEYDPGAVQHIIECIASQSTSLAAVQFYQKRIAASAEEINLVRFHDLRLFFLEESENIPTEDQQIILIYLINYASRLFRRGLPDMLSIIFDLYKLGFEENLLQQSGRIANSLFLNVITVANSIGEYDYSKAFIQGYKQYLTEEWREETVLLGGAQTDYYQKNYEACIESIRDYSFKVAFYKRRARLLLVQAYFEVAQEDHTFFSVLESYCKSFSNQMRTLRSPNYGGDEAFAKFTKYVVKLTKWLTETPKSLIALEVIEQALGVEENIQGVKWLRDKIGELKKGVK